VAVTGRKLGGTGRANPGGHSFFFNVYGHDKLVDENWRALGLGKREHYIGQVAASSAAAALKKARNNKDWRGVYGKLRIVGSE
jgi:hypothetical protein